jgi:creatinine amidohydrolase
VAEPRAQSQETPTLCVADGATFWAWHSSPRIGAWPNPAGTVVIVPICGMADWGLGHPLDAEETVLLHVLRDACRLVPADRKPLVIPPLRFAFGADPTCAFPVDQPTAHALIAEVAASIAAANFRKIVLLNSSPWNEELCGAAARDLRVSRGLHMFQVHLSALGLDFHPVRSRSRRTLQTLLTALTEKEPEAQGPGGRAKAPGWGDESVTPLPGPAVGLGAARTEGGETLAAVARHLAALISDIHERAPLKAKLTPP